MLFLQMVTHGVVAGVPSPGLAKRWSGRQIAWESGIRPVPAALPQPFTPTFEVSRRP